VNPPRGATTALAVAFALASFVLHYSLERRFDRLHVFDQYNVVFQADPNERIGAMSHGWGSAGRNIAHPNLANFTSPFVRAMAMVAVGVGIADGEEALRRSIGLVIVPFAAAVTAAALFALFLRLGLSLLFASLLTILGVVSFSSVVFASIPDHFALSVLIITAAYHLFLNTTRARAVRWWPWFVAMFVAAGITITNLMVVAILLLGSMWGSGRGRVRSAFQVVSVVAVVTLLTYASSFALNRVMNRSQLSVRKSTAWATTFISGDTFFAQAVGFPMAVANTIAPARISIGGPTPSYRPDDRYQFRFTFEDVPRQPTARSLLGLLALGIIAAGVVLSIQRRIAFGAIGIASAAIVAFNWILHGAWGDETFLYSQHWLVPILVLIALAVAAVARRYPRVTAWGVGVFVVAVTLNSLVLLETMLTILRAHAG